MTKTLQNLHIMLAFVLMALVLPAAVLPTTAIAATIKITVNEVPITDIQISQRAKLLQLERRGSSNSARIQMARKELVDEIIKLQEAEKRGLAPTDSDVNSAFQDVARNMKISSDNLSRILTQNGVNPDTLKDRLRATIAWGRVTRTVVASRVQMSEAEIEAQAAEQLTPADSIDYVLKEILFLIPKGSNVSTARRTAQANQYRRSFQGCSSAVDLSLSYTDAAVIDLGRRHATQLPDAISKELAGLDEGGITRPRVVENGVSMLAICSKTAARDLSFVTRKIRQEVGTDMLKAEAEKYLAELRDAASIVNK